MTLLPEVQDVLLKLGLEEKQIDWICKHFDSLSAGASCFYEEFTIKERAKLRKICAPKPDLKKIQQTLMRKFFYLFKPSGAAHGFVVGRSSITNAKVHLDAWLAAGSPKDWAILEIDVENFFPSIPTNEVMRVIAHILKKRTTCKKELIPKVCEVIVSICQKDGSLPMGAPTSPAISNLVMSRFDAAMGHYCRKWKLTFTRYADDVSIFGLNANKAYPMIVKQLEKLGLKIKDKKTRVLRPHRAMKVTGVVINSGALTVSRRFRHRLRAQIHNTRLHAEKAISPLCKDPRPVKLSVLEGRAGWCASVQPRHRKLVDKVRGIRRVTDP